MRLMTWNIHGAVGLDGRRDAGRIAEVVRRARPDVLCLQEVDGRDRFDGGRQIDLLADAVGCNVAEACTVRSAHREQSHVVISRWPLRDVRVHDLSVGRREPRAAIEAVVEAPGADVHLVSVHLGLDIFERRRQAGLVRAMAEAARHEVAVATGDFNDWIWPGPVERALSAVYPAMVAPRSFPARLPLLKLDRLYCRPAAALVSAAVDRSAGSASDHLPLLARLDLAAARAP